MIKKMGCSLVIGLASSISWADGGFYLGLGIGPDAVEFHQQSRVVDLGTPEHPGNFRVYENTHLSGMGVFGTVFGGYGWNQDRGYLALEINGNMSSSEYTESNFEAIHLTSSSTAYKLNNSFGISVLPGYLFTDNTLFYVRLGYASGNLKINTSDTSLANINHRLDGVRAGVGINQKISTHWHVRMEYNYFDYQATQFTVAVDAITKSTKINPSANQVEFGVVYSIG